MMMILLNKLDLKILFLIILIYIKKTFKHISCTNNYFNEIIKQINLNILKCFLDKNDKNTLYKIVFNEIRCDPKTPNNTPESSPDLGVFSPRTFKKFIIPNSEIINSIIDYISINNI